MRSALAHTITEELPEYLINNHTSVLLMLCYNILTNADCQVQCHNIIILISNTNQEEQLHHELAELFTLS